jgi:hypothetical protein
MSFIYKFLKYIILIFIALVFLYFSLVPSEFQKYTTEYKLNQPFDYLKNKYNELTFIPLNEKELEVINSKEIYINYPQKSIRYQLSDLGISFNSNRERVIDQNKFNEFERKLLLDLSYLSKSPVISLETSEFYSLGPNSSLELDKEDFLKNFNLINLLTTNSVRVIPNFKENFISEENKKANTELQNKIISKPLQLKAGRREINLSTGDIKNFIETKSEGNKEVNFINQEKIINYLTNLDQKINFPADVDYKLSAAKLSNHLLFRLTEESSSRTFILPITGTYSISPQRHPKFIEVSKSQQRAYLFDDGRLIKTYLISTGVTWETPTGEFKVLNKVPMTISYSNFWYMPWYLPIGTINGPYYFGFHEVPYHLDYKGMVYSRDPETIGSPATGGCIQLLKGQAKELFDWAEVGTPVYITE